MENQEYIRKDEIMPFHALTKITGPVERHLEQLWDEIKSLKYRLHELEKKNDLQNPL